MKRSAINALQREAVAFFQQHHFHLPPWAFWTPDDWWRNRGRAREVVDKKLGWDLTDFGLGRFREMGLILFTLRNGRPGEAGGKDYCEKVMIAQQEQVTPWHFHWHKMEDIINRGGGDLVVAVCHATPDEQLADTPVTVLTDGLLRTVPAQGEIVLRPGESITLPPRMYHQFHAARGKGAVLIGEVSRVNDDDRDNRFLAPVGRFPTIDEDEPVLYYLCTEYPAWLSAETAEH
ncbi:MAG: D-lyxose/D-mannose family sugar isomerase [candidate division KSB1 bacterium]|nr:D-lyxose/D-mannose family sugar isomerase [candidate division KSB1 bacterium]MDZ7276227.1 D-lyxose/D-mannose family sugar isomerase [candidate division KSB1 bacterium]MDZ7287967.1 D-lyxose/D-mannose family sugar isomerase [candidate division KSB1 bacterium]MDZ7300020.1 D-lyxose/D-mannose family sugar isomerase [candidate division KSB1 bacterium]MDZ7308559.1 D-lyxose/D-mannose family sugar isomerase [candidate division KSB1 bacterium]